jgi:hypothetical protein
MPRPPPPKATTPLDAAAIDALYGLEPVFEPGRADAELGAFVTVDCPYCGERYGTPVDLTGGSFTAIEDCQVCCRPLELCVEVGEGGGLDRCTVRRLD